MKARFLTSALDQLPLLKNAKGTLIPEVALVGRSNVGKSSLINHLFNQKKLAKTSATPGKTRLINFFLIDEAFCLVDLPGYGYAKAPKNEIETWSKAIDNYLSERKNLKLIFLLIDSRRDLSQEDQSILDWASYKQIPVLLVFTKTDKLSQSEMAALLKKAPEAIFYSVRNPSGKKLIEKMIHQYL